MQFMKKYFPKIFGNTDTKMRLSDAIIDKTLPHAILIVGPHGSGKSTLATEIAASANCLNQDSENHNLPCGICNNCKRIYSGNFPDISFLEKTSSKATIGVEELREFREDMFLSVYHTLEQNASLKKGSCCRRVKPATAFSNYRRAFQYQLPSSRFTKTAV